MLSSGSKQASLAALGGAGLAFPLWFWLAATFPVLRPLHHILVGLSLPMVRGGEGAKPQQGERVSKYCPHVHPLSFFSPSSLFLFQLLYALKMRDNQTSVGLLLLPTELSQTKSKFPFFKDKMREYGPIFPIVGACTVPSPICCTFRTMLKSPWHGKMFFFSLSDLELQTKRSSRQKKEFGLVSFSSQAHRLDQFNRTPQIIAYWFLLQLIHGQIYL